MKLSVILFYFMWIFGMFVIVYSWFVPRDITITLLTIIMTMVGMIGGKVLRNG